MVSDAAESGLTLADTSDEPLDMASEESAQALTGADPYFYVGATMYQFLPDGLLCDSGTEGVTCWVSAPGDNPIQDAIDYINTNAILPSDRKIYVESGTYTGDVTIDTSSAIFSSMLYGLIGAGSSTTTINGNVLINQNISGFTLSGFTINGGLTVLDSTGTLILDDLDVTNPNGDGITVENQSGNVFIKKSRSNGNSGCGAVVNYESAYGSVFITNSSFDNNRNSLNDAYEVGLRVITTKPISLEGVSASRNLGGGIELNDFNYLTIKYVMANHNAEPYNVNNVGDGIYAFTDYPAKVVIENVQANYNAGDGVYVSTNGSVVVKYLESQYNTIRTGTIENLQKVVEFLTDDMEYDEWRFEGSAGMDVLITLKSQGGIHNFDPLLRLYDNSHTLILQDDNTLDGWNAQIATTLLDDGFYYLRVYRASGEEGGRYDLSLNHDDDPIHKYEPEPSGLTFMTWEGRGTFYLLNGVFNQNAGEGLYVYNRNTVTIYNITSTNNGSDGIYINKSGSDWDCPEGAAACTLLGYSGIGSVNVTSTKSTGWLTANTVSGNSGSGLYVSSRGSIVVSNLDAISNSVGGVYLDTCLGDYYTGQCRSVGNVTVYVTIPNWVNYFGENSGNGLEIKSAGTVIIKKVDAHYNGVKGIDVSSMGHIYVYNTSAFHNYDIGAYLSTLPSLSARSIVMYDSEFSENEGTGLVAYATGSITLYGVIANDNYSPVTGTLDSVPVSVYDQIKDGCTKEIYYFYGQGGQWLDIILESLEFDVFLELNDNIGDPITFNDNSAGGTDARIIYSLPYTGWFQIAVSYIGTDETGDYVLSVNDYYHEYPVYPGSGMELDTTAGLYNVVVSTTRTNPYLQFDNNDNFGLKVRTDGYASINGASANNNYRSGIDIDAHTIVYIQDRSRTPISTFNDNGYYGIFVRTLGSIYLNGVSASGNAINGADFENCFYSGETFACTGSGYVYVITRSTALADFSNNGGYGLRVVAQGSIMFTNVNADNNGLTGAYVKNDYARGVITIRNVSAIPESSFDNNGGYGIHARSLSNILVYSIDASNNTNTGVYLDNCRESEGECLGYGYIYVYARYNTEGNFDNNAEHGIQAYSFNSILLYNVIANNNGLSGAILQNNYPGSRGSVYVRPYGKATNQFNNNGTAAVYTGSAPSYRVGLYIESLGYITLKNVEATNTSDGGKDSCLVRYTICWLWSAGSE